ncbi:response regulator [Pseudooceanicola onchidii]|uniref:response regulator n=1 Tax=Pseudooceanicola onchidii TaxID=2562279 RepID=UPI0010AADA6B|nr:response regulator [Pseudooceanicola onchidii]
MNQTVGSEDFAMNVATELPYLRRYARALTGSQTSGDNYAVATLEAILEDPMLAKSGKSTRVTLFGVFHAIWNSSGAPVAAEEAGIEARAQAHLSRLTPNTREALLLSTIEEFSFEQIGEIMKIGTAEAEEFVRIAQRELAESVTGRVMIIEDEAIIAMDLQSIVSEMGHAVTGVARTRDEAVALGKAERPDLIFADIQLADNSSGIDAVNDLLEILGDVPVIFITAYPERLLTGEKAEPAFLITKPYSEEQVRLAASQAMFFSSTETLRH